jgi:RHS repeat-associated protein
VYDAYNRRTSISDPSAGTQTYTYDNRGNIQTEKDAKSRITTYEYDNYNRLYRKIRPEFTTTYYYGAYGVVDSVSSSNGTSTVFNYDTYGRLTSEKENVPDGNFLQKKYGYNNGNVSWLSYVNHNGDICTENYYYNNGILNEVKLNGTTSIWRLDNINSLGQPAAITTGPISRNYTFDSYGLPTGRNAGVSYAFQNFSYSFNPATGNLNYRKNNIYNIQENFTYDNLNRLTGYGNNSSQYDNKGNITSKSDVGSFAYSYYSSNPYAIIRTMLNNPAIPIRIQNVTYTSFKRPGSISENGYAANFTYNGNDDRVKMSLTKDGNSELTRYYISDCYEIDDPAVGSMKEKLYLGGDFYTATAVYVKSGTGSWQLYYIARDYLGSITHVTNSTGSVTQQISYDAWGRLRDYYDQLYTPGNDPTLFLGRGYTGHEHLPWFGLINMNARLYDPAVGRFLSPDPFVQNPFGSQNFNRYSYALNNPLCYIDKDGEIVWFVPIIIGAVIGAYTGASIQSGTAAFWDWKPDAWKGAIAGGIIGATLGYGVAGAIGASGMTTIVNGASVATKAAGITSSMLNSGTINIAMNAMSGGGWDGAWKAGVAGLASGAWTATGGFGMVKGFGATSDIGKLAGKLGYQMIGTAGGSIGNNWARGEDPFSKVTMGVGPVNLTLGKGQKLLQWQNNLGNIAMNAFGLSNLAFGGKASFDWKNLSLNYSGGIIDKFYPPGIWDSGFGAHAVIGNSNLKNLYSHELHHLWQSRAFGDMFLLNYGLQGIDAVLMGDSFLENYNFFETQADTGYWW